MLPRSQQPGPNLVAIEKLGRLERRVAREPSGSVLYQALVTLRDHVKGCTTHLDPQSDEPNSLPGKLCVGYYEPFKVRAYVKKRNGKVYVVLYREIGIYKNRTAWSALEPFMEPLPPFGWLGQSADDNMCNALVLFYFLYGGYNNEGLVWKDWEKDFIKALTVLEESEGFKALRSKSLRFKSLDATALM
ncbi:hypothetical protein BDV96DRAFT_607966 [Lophiotrema nucula]|uniref:Uncharacterized protein n=1 Tax=Lophiotrema nucula TaxID=690887 RepID=A0A6A5YEQ3_9PLEO|nr:hypothetical protein BDV96DRAFT_607966 [Lophiotrema nucula]